MAIFGLWVQSHNSLCSRTCMAKIILDSIPCVNIFFVV